MPHNKTVITQGIAKVGPMSMHVYVRKLTVNTAHNMLGKEKENRIIFNHPIERSPTQTWPGTLWYTESG